MLVIDDTKQKKWIDKAGRKHVSKGKVNYNGKVFWLRRASFELLWQLAKAKDWTSHETFSPAAPLNASRYLYQLRKAVPGIPIISDHNGGYKLDIPMEERKIVK